MQPLPLRRPPLKDAAVLRRILPGSHKSTGGFGEFGRRQATEPSPYEAELLRLREEQGLTERQAEQGNLLEGWSDVEMEGEM